MDNLNKKINNCFISVKIQKDDFDVNAEIQSIRSRKIIGGIINFIGVVRDSQKEKEELVSLELEHYPGMTDKALMLLVEQAVTRFSLTAAGAVHRIGRLYNNEQIVWVGAAAPHRQAAFDAACFLMDMLKQSVPLWKKEFKGECSQWVETKASDDKAALKWMTSK